MSKLFGKKKTQAGFAHTPQNSYFFLRLVVWCLRPFNKATFEPEDEVLSKWCRWFLLSTLEMLRENKRMLDKAIRELDRERQGLQNQEKKLVEEVRKSAKQGQMVCTRFEARIFSQTDLVTSYKWIVCLWRSFLNCWTFVPNLENVCVATEVCLLIHQ